MTSPTERVESGSAGGWTPGPWSWRHFGSGAQCLYLVSRAPGKPIVLDCCRKGMQGAEFRVNVDGILCPLEEHLGHPDALLIAAAPALYEALEALVGVFPLPTTVHKAAIIEKAYAALAAARGES